MNKSLEYKKYFEGKKVTKQGFGILGRGIGVTKFLLASGAEVLVVDSKPESDFLENIKELESFMIEKNIPKTKVKYSFGPHSKTDFEKCDFVVQASGVPKGNSFLAHAKSLQIPVYQEASLFCEIIGEYNKTLIDKEKIKIVGVTGTRGKTTTTFLIYEMLKDHFGDDRIHIGGNVQGVATLDLLTTIKPGDIIVLELDSWVLQGLGGIKYSPDIAVFTNLMPDHMNYYNGNMSEYLYDKANIFLNQDNS